MAALSEFVHVVVSDGSQDAGLAVLLLSRPPTNTMTRQVYREIAAAAAEMGARDDAEGFMHRRSITAQPTSQLSGADCENGARTVSDRVATPLRHARMRPGTPMIASRLR